jgi:hypothetical protein
MTIDLKSIASEISSQAAKHPIGNLQEIRKNLKGLEQVPTQKIFSDQTTREEWAFHHGGRTELQFNIGIDHLEFKDEFRYGVAFSLKTSRTLPKIDVLIPKIALFNDFISPYQDDYADMWMWHHKNGRSSDYKPTRISADLVTEEVFIFLGKHRPLDKTDYEDVLDVFDRLLPLYKYTESGESLQPISEISSEPFRFQPGCTVKEASIIATQTEKEIDVKLRHNIFQEALYNKLAEEYGKEKVGTENPSGVGTRIDVVVSTQNGYWFYEIKTERSPRACLRQALGQLLEYSFWPGSQEANRLIVVGEPALDDQGVEYLNTLRKRFALPIFYEQIDL